MGHDGGIHLGLRLTDELPLAVDHHAPQAQSLGSRARGRQSACAVCRAMCASVPRMCMMVSQRNGAAHSANGHATLAELAIITWWPGRRVALAVQRAGSGFKGNNE